MRQAGRSATMAIVRGDEDRVLPIGSTGRRLPDLIHDSRLVEIPGGPHHIGWPHAEELDTVLTGFLGEHRR
ncbi:MULTISPECIES: alpha/beta fold hydrolase [unclassified Streptomyces]|uniref:alpha/beta fold hydrolase n=1 Tax=unclassified Streptomyces TaxID=2593676 RepID=UPI0038139533